MNESFAIVPVREFKTTKIRLSPVLTEAERAALTRALIFHVAGVLQDSKNIDKTIVVCSNSNEVSQAIGSFSKIRIVQESKIRGGVNAAVLDGFSEIRKSENNSKVMILPSDLPFLSRGALNRVVELLDQYDLVINPSQKKDGTNLLAFRLSKKIPLWYDQDSFNNHLREATFRKLNFVTLDLKQFSFDVDDPEDLSKLMTDLHADSFESLIEKL